LQGVNNMAIYSPLAANFLMQQAQQGFPNMLPQQQEQPPMAAAAPPKEAVDQGIEVEARDPIEHKGMFGVKGTLRDILGLLGDSYLMVKGRNPYYAGIRRQELLGDQLAGRYQDNPDENFINNPEVALRRMAEVGLGNEALSFYKDYGANKRADATLQRQLDRDAQLADQGLVTTQKNIQTILARTYGGITDEETLKQFNAAAEERLKKYRMEYLLPALPKNLDQAKKWGLDTYRANRLEDFDESLENQRRGQDISASTTRRGQDIRSADTRRGQDLTHTRGMAKKSGGRSAPEIPPRPPKGKNDAIRSPSGATFISRDGKTWERSN
jgi:hypothetical protein